MKRIAESFPWPFRAPASAWVAGLVAVVALPIGFVALFGYAVAATRAAALDPPAPPPPWRYGRRLIVEGLWVAAALSLTLLPFAALFFPLVAALHGFGSIAAVVAFFVLALPWGLVALLVLPQATARYAASGRPRDMLDFAASVRGVRHDFATWNVAVGAIVTAWVLGLAGVGLLGVGVVAGVFYAILVSAHACAALARPEGARSDSTSR